VRTFSPESPPREREKLWKLARIMRRRVFVEECGVVAASEWDDFDATSRHRMAFLGDAPIAYLRWRVAVGAGGRAMAVIERICTLKHQRQRGNARRMIGECLQDIAAFQASGRTDLAEIRVVLPFGDTKFSTCLSRVFASFNFRPVAGTMPPDTMVQEAGVRENDGRGWRQHWTLPRA
jgi:hypothetical protein